MKFIDRYGYVISGNKDALLGKLLCKNIKKCCGVISFLLTYVQYVPDWDLKGQ